MKSWIILVIAMMITAGFSPAYCEPTDEGQKTATAYGTVNGVDWVGSVLVVGDTQFLISSDTEIVKGLKTIGFLEVKIGDSVIVTYYGDSSGSLIAVRIVVSYSGNFPT